MGDLGGVAYWALAGLVVVTANPALRAAELHYVLEQSRSAGLFHAAAFRGSDMTAIAREAAAGLPELRAIFCFTGWRATVAAHRGGGSLPAVRRGDAAQIQYTSGTTGFPKGERVRDDGRRTAPCLGPAGFRWEGEVICAVAAND